MKTLKEWNDSKQDFTSYCQPSDKVDEEIYWYFLEVLPPAIMTHRGFMVGEAYDHDSQGNPLYATFRIAGKDEYVYLGHMTVKEFKWRDKPNQPVSDADLKATT